MVTLTIDGREVQAEEGKSILEVARDNNISIPSLCYHEGVDPYGACRLCMVEIVSRGRERLVASCLYPVEDGLVVRTATPTVIHARKMILELLIAQCPTSKTLQDLAAQMGLEKVRFAPKW